MEGKARQEIELVSSGTCALGSTARPSFSIASSSACRSEAELSSRLLLPPPRCLPSFAFVSDWRGRQRSKEASKRCVSCVTPRPIMKKQASGASAAAVKFAASDRGRGHQPLDRSRRDREYAQVSAEEEGDPTRDRRGDRDGTDHHDEESDGVFRFVGPAGLSPDSEGERYPPHSSPAAPERATAIAALGRHLRQVFDELSSSAGIVLLRPRLNVLMIGGIVAVAGDTTRTLGEPICFCLSGLALIPCAERLSFITEQVAEHTNGTIGALLNATFGNAPELLISVAALRSGFYRVVQLAMLGSILTNMMLVFGVACLIGGLRWQVQVLRLTSGNVSVVMLLVSTAGFLFPAALLLSGQFDSYDQKSAPAELEAYVPSQVEISFGRVNAAVMMILYVLFLLFTLGTHYEEFDSEALKEHSERRAQRNLFCLRQFRRARGGFGFGGEGGGGGRGGRNGAFQAVPTLELFPMGGAGVKAKTSIGGDNDSSSFSSPEGDDGVGDADPHEDASGLFRLESSLPFERSPSTNGHPGRSTIEMAEEGSARAASFGSDAPTVLRRGDGGFPTKHPPSPISSTLQVLTPPASPVTSLRMKNYTDHLLGASPLPLDEIPELLEHRDPSLSMRAGILWLFVLTLCVSALSDILVDTIDGFAQRMNLSQVFTSMVVVPFFSNVAEQVSAFIFAYRNEMDLVVGVTIGSAIQIASFVLPGSVLIGMVMDRSMTLYFRGYETVCMLFGVIVVGAVLQNGTTNWLVGAVLVGIYIIMATGIWYHEFENLSVDGEDLIRNATHPN